ncbi:MAG TPA: TerC family protein [Pirellulales bacterium]|jgi:tellurite resistance protein TerC|nr:TerC family protein [Pirellulales bacterium]
MLQPALWHWIAFIGFILAMLAFDLLVLSRGGHEPTFRESLGWTAFWTGLAIGFNGLIWYAAGVEAAARFLAGYLVEWSLSLDNVFVFIVIFAYFQVPREHQHRVLFWGILGAIVMRMVFVVVGMELIAAADWVLPLFGMVIIYLGAKLAIQGEPKVEPERNLVLRAARRVFRVAEGDHGGRFFVRDEAGRRRATSLFLVLLAIESADVVFAFDSVPAIFGVARDPFLVFSSNVLAILGLRALYFLLSGLIDRFRHINYGISAVLVFVGIKMIADYAAKRFGWIAPDRELVPYWAALAVITTLLVISIAISLLVRPTDSESPPTDPAR